MARRQTEKTRGSGTLLEAIVRGAGPFQSMEERAAGLAHLRESGADGNAGIDRYLLERLAQMGDALGTVEEQFTGEVSPPTLAFRDLAAGGCCGDAEYCVSMRMVWRLRRSVEQLAALVHQKNLVVSA